jgi:tRNA1(Val) A37 N6-methylase TrmN6
MEVVNDLLNYNNMKIFQNTDWFSFSLDSVLLANFVVINKKTKKIIDFCTGNAPIPMILSTKTDKEIIGVELQKEIFELAQKSIKINNLENQVNLINENIKKLPNLYETDSFDIITCNPPFFKLKSDSKYNDNLIKSIARHEIEIELDEIFSIAKKLLKNNGSICMVHRTDRLIDIITSMKKNNIEPKRIRLVYPKINQESNIVLIEGTKNGNSGLKILPPLYVHDKDGNYLEEIKKMFEGE